MPTPQRRTVPRQIEILSKRQDWRSIALVGVSEPDVAQWLVQTARRARLTVVATWPEEGELRRAKLAGNQRQLRRLARANSDRLTFLEADPADALKAVGDDRFDAVAVFELDQPTSLRRWAQRVNEGGMLLGIDWRDEDTQGALKDLVPDYEKLHDGLWCARIRGPVPEGEERGEPQPVKSEPVPELKEQVERAGIDDAPDAPATERELDIEARAAASAEEPPAPAKRPRGRPRKAKP